MMNKIGIEKSSPTWRFPITTLLNLLRNKVTNEERNFLIECRIVYASSPLSHFIAILRAIGVKVFAGFCCK